jgi:hypothetical protein
MVPPPAARTTRSSISSGSRPSKGNSNLLKVLKGIFSICQSKKHDLDVVKAQNETILNNQCNIHQKLKIEEPFKEFEEEKLSSEIADPFASLTMDQITYFGMGNPSASSSAPHDDDDEEYDEVTSVEEDDE